MSTRKPDKDVIDDSGLRYANKVTGSPFVGSMAAGSKPTKSCFRCGRHQLQERLEYKKLLGKTHAVCKGGCGTSS